MKVLSIGNLYPPASAGGYERIWVAGLRALTGAGHEVRVLTTDAPADGAGPEGLPPAHRELRWYWRDGDFSEPSWAERRATERHNARVLHDHLGWAPDVVSWWGLGGMTLGLVDQVRRAGFPAVGVVGDGWMIYGPRVDRPVALGPYAHWIFISRAVRDRALEEGYVFPRSSIAHPGVDPTRFPRAPAREWAWRLAYVGRVSPEKGVDTARRALALLPAEATLVLDGPGGDVQTPHDRIHETYAAADAVVFPVEWPEPWGLVPLEAMSVGRPVVATGTGGSGEYLAHARNCLLFEPGDAAGLAAAVHRLAEDAGLRERLVAGGRETAARYTQAAFEAAVVAAHEAAVS